MVISKLSGMRTGQLRRSGLALFALFIVTLFMTMTASAQDARPDIVVADFNGSDYGDWKVEGEAFGAAPARGTLPTQMEVSGFEGAGLVNSYVGGDDTVGKLTSPEFKIERPYINYLVGGGMNAEKLGMRLIIDGKTVRSATGLNDRPGGSERLEMQTWDVAEFVGKTARLEIFDNAVGGWGHINIDNVVQSDVKKALVPADKTRLVTLDKPYLIFPVANSARQTIMTIVVDGILVHKLKIPLADSTQNADWYAFLDVPEYVGKTAEISVEDMAVGSEGLKLIRTANDTEVDLINKVPRYSEQVRPQLRFSQKQGWNNDPNGMVYLNGKYHLFWQSNPVCVTWENMYWGHAVSSDLVHWTELPMALRPLGGDVPFDKRFPSMAKGQCWSGSANVMRNDSSPEAKSTIIAAFTDTGCGESLAISRDEGKTWRYESFNPIIRHKGRDPKLVWYEKGQYWVIALYDEGNGPKIAFYKSDDLKSWEKTGEIDGFFECPEMFKINLDGNPENSKWVLWAANAEYVVGQFDGKTFIPDEVNADGSVKKFRSHDGMFYASQCFSNAPGGRVIQIGWTLHDYYRQEQNLPFNHGFSLPLELTLRTTPEGPRLFSNPVKEFETLRTKKHEARSTLDSQSQQSVKLDCASPDGDNLFDITLRFKPGTKGDVVLSVGNDKLIYHCSESRFEGSLAAERNNDGMRHPLPILGIPDKDGYVTVRIVRDRALVEAVFNDGRLYRVNGLPGPASSQTFELSGVDLDAPVPFELDVWNLKSIWK